MSLRFPYKRFRRPAPVWTLGGRSERPRPVCAISILGPRATHACRAVLDTGADDTVFPEDIAALIGIDLSNAPMTEATGMSGLPLLVRCAAVQLRLTDGSEFREWPARVAFAPPPFARTLLGFAGCLQFFDADFLGASEEAILTVNANYPGK